MPINAEMKYNGHRWVTAAATIMNLLGLSMWLWAAPGWLAFAACGALQVSLVLVLLRYKAEAKFWRIYLQQDIANVVGKALFAEYKGQVEAKPMPSEVIQDAMKDMVNGQ